MPDRSDHVANIQSSFQSALDAMSHLEHSLQAAGFQKNAAVYEKMARTLMQQSLWLKNNHPEVDLKEAGKVAYTAGLIGEQLGPYVRIMKMLRGLGETQEESSGLSTQTSGKAGPPLSREEQAVLGAVQELPRCTKSRIVTKTQISKRKVVECLSRLEALGLVRVSQGSRPTYHPG